MGYLHIENLYKNQEILMFKECYALEKIHGTSASITFKTNPSNPSQWQVTFFSGGESYENFAALFEKDQLLKAFLNEGTPCDKNVIIYGEAYGGKQQGMSHTYGTRLKFIAFDVSIGENGWLNVPEAESFCKRLGIEFVPYARVSTDLKELDAQRNANSVQAVRNGITDPKKREGVVLRPIIDLIKTTGARIICKHKGDEFRETASPRVVDDPSKLKVLADADIIATEWVTATRLDHVLDKIPGAEMKHMPVVLKAMIEDVTREAAGEIVDNDVVRKAITKRTATLFKNHLGKKLVNG